MRGDGCWYDYTQRKESREREEKNEGTRDVERDREDDRVNKDRGKKTEGSMDEVVKKMGGKTSR